MRHRKTDAHIATLRVRIPISMMHLSTVTEAAEAINGIQAHLPPGSTVEVLNSRFGRVDAPQILTMTHPAMLEPQTLSGEQINEATRVWREAKAAESSQLDIESALASVREQVTAGAVDPLAPPESLRRVPRPAPNGG